MRRRNHSILTITATATAVVVGGLGLVACGNDDPDRDPGTTTSPVTVTATTTPSPAPSATGNSPTPDTTAPTTAPTTATSSVSTQAAALQPLGNPDLAAKQRAAQGPYGLMVTGVRIATHPTFDRVVFDFAGEGDPGWYVDYTETPAAQGSGFPVDYEGVIALQVGIEGTAYPFDLGMEPVDLGTVQGKGHVTEVIYTSLFEGRTEFVIGMTQQLPYSVTALQNPPRLVIDVVHG